MNDEKIINDLDVLMEIIKSFTSNYSCEDLDTFKKYLLDKSFCFCYGSKSSYCTDPEDMVLKMVESMIDFVVYTVNELPQTLRLMFMRNFSDAIVLLYRSTIMKTYGVDDEFMRNILSNQK